jgi:small subunit ribosomal protein S20
MGGSTHRPPTPDRGSPAADQNDRNSRVPNKDSAKKRMRQDAVKHSRNLWRRRRIKNQVSALLTAIHDGSVQTAEDEFRKACSVLDKIAATGTIHKNTAARRKSRLSRKLRDMKTKAASKR